MTAIPWERRPVEDPAEAKRLALHSMYASRQARSRPRRTPSPPMTPSAQRYLEAELRWQSFLRRKASRRSGRDVLDLARAKRARLRRTDAYVHGLDPTPMGRSSDKEVQELGEESKAMPRPGGGYWFPLVTVADLDNCVAAYRALKPSEKTGVRSWIIQRAILLGLVERLPKGWATPKQKLHPNELTGPREGVGGGEVALPEGGGQTGGSSTGGGTPI